MADSRAPPLAPPKLTHPDDRLKPQPAGFKYRVLPSLLEDCMQGVERHLEKQVTKLGPEDTPTNRRLTDLRLVRKLIQQNPADTDEIVLETVPLTTEPNGNMHNDFFNWLIKEENPLAFINARKTAKTSTQTTKRSNDLSSKTEPPPKKQGLTSNTQEDFLQSDNEDDQELHVTDEDEDMHTGGGAFSSRTWPAAEKGHIKPPPIVIDLPTDHTALKILEAINLSTQHGIRTITKHDTTDVLCFNESDKNAAEDLIKRVYPHIGFFTYTSPSNRQFRQVARPVPTWMTEDDISEACVKEGLPKPILVRRLTYRTTVYDEEDKPKTVTRPSLSVLIGFPKNTKRADVVNKKYLGPCKIQWEKPNPRDIQAPPLCKKCGRTGHLQTNCSRRRVCLRCASDHDTEDCESSVRRCTVCNKTDHTAVDSGMIQSTRDGRKISVPICGRMQEQIARMQDRKEQQQRQQQQRSQRNRNRPPTYNIQEPTQENPHPDNNPTVLKVPLKGFKEAQPNQTQEEKKNTEANNQTRQRSRSRSRSRQRKPREQPPQQNQPRQTPKPFKAGPTPQDIANNDWLDTRELQDLNYSKALKKSYENRFVEPTNDFTPVFAEARSVQFTKPRQEKDAIEEMLEAIGSGRVKIHHSITSMSLITLITKFQEEVQSNKTEETKQRITATLLKTIYYG